MTIAELQILINLSYDNICALLEKHSHWIGYSYLFIDSEDGHCYLFDENGKIDDIRKLKTLYNGDVKKDIKKIVIPGNVKSIGYETFYDCASLTSIEIPKSVKSIGYWAFRRCTSLKEVIFKSKTMYQIKTMDEYPWGIKDESIIKCH